MYRYFFKKSLFTFYRSRNALDSGFNSEIPSCGCGIGLLPGMDLDGAELLAGFDQPSQQDLDFPSALLVSDINLNSGFLAQYGMVYSRFGFQIPIIN